MSGYVNCGCRDCFDTAITDDDHKPALCLLCKDAGCGIHHGNGEVGTECQRDDGCSVGTCPACGQAVDYCQGHGAIGDPEGFRILEQHENDNHADCDPWGCDEAGQDPQASAAL